MILSFNCKSIKEENFVVKSEKMNPDPSFKRSDPDLYCKTDRIRIQSEHPACNICLYLKKKKTIKGEF